MKVRLQSARQFLSFVAGEPKDLLANLLGMPLFNQFGWLVVTRILRFLVNPAPLLVIVLISGLIWEFDVRSGVVIGISYVVAVSIGRFLAPFSYSDVKVKRSFFASLWVRHLDTGSSGAEEAELTALENPIYDVQRLGVKIKPSPRHADLILMTGSLTRNMQRAALRTFSATPNARILRVGDAAYDGGLLKGSYALADRRDPDFKIFFNAECIRGDPPRPRQMLETLAQETRRKRRNTQFRDNERHG